MNPDQRAASESNLQQMQHMAALTGHAEAGPSQAPPAQAPPTQAHPTELITDEVRRAVEEHVGAIQAEARTQLARQYEEARAQIGVRDAANQALAQELAEAERRMAELSQQVAALTSHVGAGPPQTPPAQVPAGPVTPAPGQGARPNRVPVPEVKFSGHPKDEKSNSLADFYFHLKLYCANMTAEQELLTVLSRLEGPAHRWLTDNLQAGQFQTWDSAYAKMKGVFLPEDESLMAMRALSAIKQGRSTVEMYDMRFTQHLNTLKKADPGIEQSIMAVEWYQKGLNEEFREAVIRRVDIAKCTLAEAQAAARAHAHAYRNSGRGAAPAEGDPMDLSALRGQAKPKGKGGKQNRRGVSEEERQRRWDHNLCFRCGEPGHQLKDCRNSLNLRGPPGNGGKEATTVVPTQK